MFNLLPNIFKDEIKSEYKLRKWIVLLSFVFLIQLFFLVSAFPLWVISNDKENEISEQIKTENETVLAQSKNDILKIINSTNQKVTIFNTTMSYPKVLPIYNSIIDAKTSDIVLSQFNYVSFSNDNSVSIKGISSTRESLVAFVKRLQELDNFGKVDLPVSNLAKQKNLDFSINIKINN